MNAELITPSERSLLLRLHNAGCPVEVPRMTYPISVFGAGSDLGVELFPFGDALVLAVRLRLMAFSDVRLRQLKVAGEWFPQGGSFVTPCAEHNRYCVHRPGGRLSWQRGFVLNEITLTETELLADSEPVRWLLLTFPTVPEALMPVVSITFFLIDHHGFEYPFPLTVKYGLPNFSEVAPKTEPDEVI